MNFKKILSFAMIVPAMAIVSSCGDKASDGAMLQGHADVPEGTDIQIAYSPDYDIMETQYIKVDLDSLGNFEFNPEFPDGVTERDIQLYVGNSNLGAFLAKGDVTNIDIKMDGYKAVAEFSGDNVEVNRFVNRAAEAFDIMRYFSLDENDTTTTEQYRELLDSEYAALKPLLADIKDSKLKEYYTAVADGKYKWQIARLIMDRAYHEGKKEIEYPEYVEIVRSVDPNDEIAGRTNLISLWIKANLPVESEFGNPSAEPVVAELALIDSAITNEANHRSATSMAANSYLVYSKPTPDQVEIFMDAFKKTAAKYPDLIEKYGVTADNLMKAVQPGQEMPYIPMLETPDGKEISLKDLYGKVIYIDVWATWCGPCRKEIPKFAELVERFKGNNKVEFISISVDEDVDAWKELIAADKPAWPQYRLAPEQNKKFSAAMGITGIPRFILIGADGKLVAPDAARPSDSNIDEIINAAIQGK